jgi:peroxiredoxin
VRDRLDQFGDAAVAVVAFSAPEYVEVYQRDRLAPITVLVDEDRATYRAYGLGRGSAWKVWGPKMWWSYAQRLGRGQSIHRPTEDTLQMGGDFVIGRDGRVAFAFRSEDPDDRPSVDALLDAVRRS